MGRARSYICDSALGQTDHTSSCHTKHPYVEGCDVGSMSSDDGIVDRRTSVFDDTDIGCCTSDLEVNTIGCAQVHQGSHNGCRRSGEHRQHRTLLHLVDLHDTAVSSHDHQRHFHACRADAFLCRVCRVQHLRKDTCIDCGRPRPSCQAVQLGNVRRHTGLHSHLVFRHIIDCLLAAHIIYAESFRSNDNFRTFLFHFFRRSFDGIVIQIPLFNETACDLDPSSGSKINVFQLCLRFCQESLQPASCGSNDSDFRHVSFDECVGRLCRTVSDKHNIFRINIIFFQAVFKRLNNSGCHTFLVIVCRLDRGLSDDFLCRIVDGHCFCMCTADVDSHSDFSSFHSFDSSIHDPNRT